MKVRDQSSRGGDWSEFGEVLVRRQGPELLTMGGRIKRPWHVSGRKLRLRAVDAIHFNRARSRRFGNGQTLRVLGLQRSGNHPIINWIFLNHGGTVCFLNSLRTRRHYNPYLTFSEAMMKVDGEVSEVLETGVWSKQEPVRRWHEAHPWKDCVIYSYEEKDLRDLAADRLSRHHERCLGRSRRVSDVLILRDPYNWLASRMKLAKLRAKLSEDTMAIWKQYAREFLGRSQYLRRSKIPINYNRWCMDAGYRAELAGRLGLEGTERGLNDVPRDGGGSSFDGQVYDGQAAAMPVHERWREFAGDPVFRRFVQDQELVELSEAVFGPIAGTEELWR